MTKPRDLDDEATFLAVNPAMDDDGVDDDAATRVVSSRAYVDDAEHAALLRELHAPSAPARAPTPARAPMRSTPFIHEAGPSAVQDEPVGLGGTVILMPDAVPAPAAPHSSPAPVAPAPVAPEPPPAPRASLPSIPASEPVPPILAEAPPQRAPALVVAYLAVCGVLTVIGLALLAWLKLEHRW
jgi:hypothetical protein